MAGIPSRYKMARGMTLIEMVVVIGIISILLMIGSLRFSDLSRGYKSEAQTRMIYEELQKARGNAVFRREPTRVILSTNRFDVYAAATDQNLLISQPLTYPITFSKKEIIFDERGLTTAEQSICIEPEDGAGAVDSVVVAVSRTTIGKRKSGGGCRGDDIVRK